VLSLGANRSDAQRSVVCILWRSMAATWWGTCKGISVWGFRERKCNKDEFFKTIKREI